jgi:D-sedoheptulose 7-phosphate isomerase
LSKKLISEYLSRHLLVLDAMAKNNNILTRISYAASLIHVCSKTGHRVFVCGNGGSAGDAQHLVGEFLGSFEGHELGIKAECLNSNTSTLTAIANDFGYDEVFSHQLKTQATEGDILFAITTSGKSENILKALKTAESLGMTTILLTGNKYVPRADNGCDYLISVPSEETPVIQEMHITLCHALCMQLIALGKNLE